MIEVSVWTCTARDLVSASEDYRCLRFDVIPSLKPTRSFLLGRRIPAALKFESEVCAIQRSVSAGFACGQGNATRHVGAYPRYQAQILVLVGLSSGVLVHCPGANWTLESVGSDSSRTARLTKRLPNLCNRLLRKWQEIGVLQAIPANQTLDPELFALGRLPSARERDHSSDRHSHRPHLPSHLWHPRPSKPNPPQKSC